jgi:putative Mn2+ efflux pump MntP
VVVAVRSAGHVKAACLAAAAGTCFGVSSTLMKTFAHLLGQGITPMLRAWEPYALGLVIAVGFLLLSSAFQAADLRAALPAVESAEPLVASVLGLTLMKERFDLHSAGDKFLIAAAVVGMALSTVQLASSSAATVASDATVAVDGA